MAHLLIRETVISDRRLPLPGKVVVFGRSLDADIPVPHRSVSRRHALLERTEEGWVFSDLGSVNGSFLGDRRLEPGERAPVPLGATFRVGSVDFILAPDEVLDDGPAPATTASSSAAAPPIVGSALKPTAPAAPAVVLAPPKGAGRLSPAVAKRAAMRKKRRDALRWMGVLVTVVLLGFAAFFVQRIVARERAKRPVEAVVEEKKAPEEPHEIQPLSIPGD
ncbi:MAG: FHA domain-containing protein [Planctomycetota bacterium]|jgi:hypothetical protein